MEREGKITSPPKIQKSKKKKGVMKGVGRGDKNQLSDTDSFWGGIPVVCVYGSLFGWSEYYLIPMMEVKARKKRELSAEPVGKTHRCIPRYIRAL